MVFSFIVTPIRTFTTTNEVPANFVAPSHIFINNRKQTIMRFNKKIFIPVLVVITIISIAVYVVSYFNKTQYVPVSFDFNVKTREVVFSIDEGYKIHRIQMLEGNISVPEYDNDTREILFPAWKLSIGEQEFVYFVIQNYPGKVAKEYALEYEVLHQSANEIIISVRKSNSRLGEKDVYTFYY